MRRVPLGGYAMVVGIVVLAPLVIFAIVLADFQGFGPPPPPAEMWVPYPTPSPSGTSVALKQYPPTICSYNLAITTDARTARSRTMPILDENTRCGLQKNDGLVVGWNGDHHLTIGWPVGVPIRPGPKRVDDVDISYINYELDLAKTTPRQIDGITLQDVQYAFTETHHYSNLTDCAIRVTGHDGALFDGLVLNIVAHGVGVKRIPGLGTGAVSLEFALVGRQDGKSPQLTPTQAKIDSVWPYPGFAGQTSGPLQQGLSLHYGGIYIHTAHRLFEVIQRGRFHIRVSLTFSERVISYVVDRGLPPAVADAFARCEANTNIFITPLIGQQD